jgi:methanogenic corrinoid protein MtbC1
VEADGSTMFTICEGAYPMDRDTPTFNLKAVVQETGIKPDTLRAWERRYGLPEPNRSAGGHRLYSQRDIDTLLWLMARQDEGLTISRAVELWRSIETEDRDPLRVPEYSLNATAVLSVQGEELKVLSKRWVEACVDFDERAAERVLTQAFAVYPVETVCTDILQKGLQVIGDGWYEGTMSVQQEHFASALAMRRIDALLGASPLPTRTGRILIACPPGEEHVFGQALLQLLLRRRGWETIYLGSNVPIERLETSVEMVRPHLVLLTAQRLQTAASLKEMAEALQDKRTPVGFGGGIFSKAPQLRQQIPGHFLGESLNDALSRVEELVPVAPALPVPEPLSPAYQSAVAHFQMNQLAINARVAQLIHTQSMEIPPSQLSMANLNLAQSIIAALKLGDINLLNLEMNWLNGLLLNHDIGYDILVHYLTVYSQAAGELLGPEGRPVLVWFETWLTSTPGDPVNDKRGSRKGKNNANNDRNGFQS